MDGVPTWLSTTRTKIVAMELDLILYGSYDVDDGAPTRHVAPGSVQVTSHGHPVTSGIQTIDYYVSWGAAEIDSAADHYTEELVLFPSEGVWHQYHDPSLSRASRL